MNLNMKISARLAASLLCAAAVLPAFAVDGVTLIDQNHALAGAVTPGDTAGFPISINQPGTYRLSGNLTVPLNVNGIEINADGVTIDLNGFSITGPGLFPNPGLGIVSTDHQRMSISNGNITGFVTGLNFVGTSRLIVLDRLIVDSSTHFANGSPVGGVGAILGRTVSSYSLVTNSLFVGQVQIACPGVITDTVAQVAEMVVPYNGTGISFPTNCKGSNVVGGPFN